MTAFTVKGTIHNLEVGFIVTPVDHLLAEFRVEMTTGSPKPAIVEKNGKKWLVKQYGCMPFTNADIKNLGREILDHLVTCNKQMTVIIPQAVPPLRR